MALCDRTTNWSDKYSVFGCGTAYSAPPGVYKATAVTVSSRSGTTLANIGWSFPVSGATSDFFVLQLSLY